VSDIERYAERRDTDLKSDLDGLGGKHEQHMRDFHYARPLGQDDDDPITTVLS
jgi:hypothetical protein